MRLWSVPVRITRATKCREGFYLIVNGRRVRFANKKAALDAIDSLFSMQKIQVVTVREYVESHRAKIKARQPSDLVQEMNRPAFWGNRE